MPIDTKIINKSIVPLKYAKAFVESKYVPLKPVESSVVPLKSAASTIVPLHSLAKGSTFSSFRRGDGRSNSNFASSERAKYETELTQAFSTVNFAHFPDLDNSKSSSNIFFINLPTCSAPNTLEKWEEFRNIIRNIFINNERIRNSWKSWILKKINGDLQEVASSFSKLGLIFYNSDISKPDDNIIYTAPDKNKSSSPHPDWYCGFNYDTFIEVEAFTIGPQIPDPYSFGTLSPASDRFRLWRIRDCVDSLFKDDADGLGLAKRTMCMISDDNMKIVEEALNIHIGSINHPFDLFLLINSVIDPDSLVIFNNRMLNNVNNPGTYIVIIKRFVLETLSKLTKPLFLSKEIASGSFAPGENEIYPLFECGIARFTFGDPGRSDNPLVLFPLFTRPTMPGTAYYTNKYYITTVRLLSWKNRKSLYKTKR